MREYLGRCARRAERGRQGALLAKQCRKQEEADWPAAAGRRRVARGTEGDRAMPAVSAAAV